MIYATGVKRAGKVIFKKKDDEIETTKMVKKAMDESIPTKEFFAGEDYFKGNYGRNPQES